jgi:hypothetical protein
MTTKQKILSGVVIAFAGAIFAYIFDILPHPSPNPNTPIIAIIEGYSKGRPSQHVRNWVNECDGKHSPCNVSFTDDDINANSQFVIEFSCNGIGSKSIPLSVSGKTASGTLRCD